MEYKRNGVLPPLIFSFLAYLSGMTVQHNDLERKTSKMNKGDRDLNDGSRNMPCKATFF
jgi:hypothetical protein